MYVVAAGVLESLSAMAHAHLELGIASPFLVSTLTSLSFRSNVVNTSTWKK